MVKKGNFNRAPLGCFFKIYRYWYTDLLFEVKFYFVSEHLPDDSDKLAGTVPKCIVVRPAFSPLGIIIPWCPPSIIIVDLIEISTLSEKHSGNIQLINNSDKGSGNTLQLSSQATGKNQKSIVSELYWTTILKERKRVIINFLIIIQENIRKVGFL